MRIFSRTKSRISQEPSVFVLTFQGANEFFSELKIWSIDSFQFQRKLNRENNIQGHFLMSPIFEALNQFLSASWILISNLKTCHDDYRLFFFRSTHSFLHQLSIFQHRFKTQMANIMPHTKSMKQINRIKCKEKFCYRNLKTS